MQQADEALFLNPDYFKHTQIKGNIYLCQDDFEAAEREFKKIMAGETETFRYYGRRCLAELYKLQGRFSETQELYMQGLEKAVEQDDKLWRVRHLLYLADLALIIGNPAEALSRADAALLLAQEESLQGMIKGCWLTRGLAALKSGEMDEVRKAVDELAASNDPELRPSHKRRLTTLQGLVELEHKNYPAAVDSLETVVLLYRHQVHEMGDHHARYLYPLGRAYFESGDLDKAQETFAKITGLTTGRLFQGHLYARSFLMLGKICERLGQRKKALANYGRFLSLWKNADPGLPEIEEVRARVQVLQD
jgi:tetratricopeptide (TPR) repeat protein